MDAHGNMPIAEVGLLRSGGTELTVEQWCAALPADDERVDALIADIRANGIQVALTVVRYGYAMHLTDGHHRFAAAKALGLTELPVVIAANWP